MEGKRNNMNEKLYAYAITTYYPSSKGCIDGNNSTYEKMSSPRKCAFLEVENIAKIQLRHAKNRNNDERAVLDYKIYELKEVK